MSDIVLQCDELVKTFQFMKASVDVLKGVSLSVAPGELVGIVGTSGTGKSTLLHLLGGLDVPTSGQVSVMGQSLADMKEHAKSALRNKHLGFIYQFHHLLPEFSALENICLPLQIAGVNGKKARLRALEMIERVGLIDRQSHRVGELSGGERQRIAIARALINSPQCILADEPTGNLDEHTAQGVFDLMLELNQSLNTSFVIVTHNLVLAHRLDRVLSLTNGVLQEMTKT